MKKEDNIFEIYKLIQQKTPRNVVTVDKVVRDENTDSVIITLSPIGTKVIPERLSHEEQIDAIQSVLNALVDLHEIGITHRDIRWENVLQHEEGHFFLIDFDEACFGTSPNARMDLAAASHAPEIQKGSHGPSVDIWSVVYLCSRLNGTIWKKLEKLISSQANPLK